MLRITLLMSGACAAVVFVLLAFVTMLFVKHGDNKPT